MDQIVTGKSYIDAARHYVATIKWQQILTHYVVIKKGRTGAMEGACYNRRRPRKGCQIGRM